jgi:uncharacterized protein (TIGR03437 family)
MLFRHPLARRFWFFPVTLLVLAFGFRGEPAWAQPACPNPTFTAQPPIASNGRPRPVAAADFNGDGRLDLAVGNSISLFGGVNIYNITTLLNTGGGNFTPAPGSPRGIEEGPIALAAADFNGDGRMDLAVAGEISRKVTVLLGVGTGEFNAAGPPLDFPTRPTYLVAADFNADGKPDLAVTKAAEDPQSPRPDENNVNILLGNGAGGFAAAPGSPFAVGMRPFFAAVGEFNGDGRPDLAVANLDSRNVSILLGQAGGAFTPAPGSPVSVPGQAYAVVAADFNGDARTDLVVKNTLGTLGVSGFLSVLLGNGSGGFAPAPSFGAVTQPSTIGFFGYIVAADFDKDNRMDVVSANPNGSDVNVWLGDGGGGFKQRQRISTISNAYGVAAAEFDGGGGLDLAVTFESQEKVIVFLGACGIAANTPPAISPVAPLSRQQGSAAGAAVTVATVSDAETPAGNLAVGVSSAPAGITVSGLTNTNGTVTAVVAAACNAAPGVNTVVLTVTDASSATTTANLTVNVSADTPPTLGNYPAASLVVGNSANVTPSAAPADNGSVASLTVTGSAGFGGGLSGDRTTGVVSISNAAPVGSHTLTVVATDNCGATTTRTIALTIMSPPNTAPTITAAAGISRQQGSVGRPDVIATVGDAETTAGNLSVTASTDDTIIVSSIVNNNGTVTATVAAACGASPGSNTIVLRVTDGGGLNATTTLTINVTGNAPPVLGSYPTGTNLGVGANATAPTSAAPADNGAVASVSVSASAGFGGSLSVEAATGVVTITNARPAGEYVITVTATDNCGLAATTTFPLLVTKNATTVALSASPGPYLVGQPVTLTAMVSGASGLTPTGTVTFLDGTTALGTAQLDTAGKASFTTSSLSPGARGLTAGYAGDANFNSANSSGLAITVGRTVTNVSAANYRNEPLSPEAIVAAFGTGLATTTLGGTAVRIRDSAGTERLAPLFFVSPTQVNYLLPAGTVAGAAAVTILASDGAASVASIQVTAVSPGMFSADATGMGLAAAVLLRARADGSRSFEPIARFDSAQNKIVAVPIDFGAPTDELFLIPYGTAFRNRSSLSAVNVKIGGTDVETFYAGPQGSLDGLDQINARLPRTLAGRGDVDVVVTVDGRTANAVKVNFR